MSKIVLTPVTGANNLSTLNDNFQKIADAVNDQLLSRNNPEGEPNDMVTDLDMGGKRIYNLPKAIHPSEPVRQQDLGDLNTLSEQARGYAERAEEAANSSLASQTTALQAAVASQTSASNANTDRVAVEAVKDYTDDLYDDILVAEVRIQTLIDQIEPDKIVHQTDPTGAAMMPKGTTAEAGTPEKGYIRFNADTNKFEGGYGDRWDEIGGAGATGGDEDKVFYENDGLMTADFTITRQTMTVGPLVFSPGTSLSFAAGSRLVIL